MRQKIAAPRAKDTARRRRRRSRTQIKQARQLCIRQHFNPQKALGPNIGVYSSLNRRDVHVDCRIVLFQWPPFVYEQSDGYTGLCMQLLGELSKNLNFRFVWVSLNVQCIPHYIQTVYRKNSIANFAVNRDIVVNGFFVTDNKLQQTINCF